MIFEAVAGVILIAISFLLMGFYSQHEYIKVFYLVVSLIMIALSSGIISSEATFLPEGITLPIIMIGIWGLAIVVSILLIKLIIDIFSSKIVPWLKIKDGIEI
jgi:hypothetical protein